MKQAIAIFLFFLLSTISQAMSHQVVSPNELLLLAAQHSSSTHLKAALKLKADVATTGDFGETALHWAAKTSNRECLNLLLEAGADQSKADNNGELPIHWAMKKREPEKPSSEKTDPQKPYLPLEDLAFSLFMTALFFLTS